MGYKVPIDLPKAVDISNRGPGAKSYPQPYGDGPKRWGGPERDNAGGWIPGSSPTHSVSRHKTPSVIFQKSNYKGYAPHKQR